jgi:hypothetical protein
MTRVFRAWPLLAAAVAFAWASPAAAQGQGNEKKPKKVKSHHEETDDPATAEDAPAHKGMQAYVDADGGRLRKPTAAEEQTLAEELAKLVNDSHEGLTAVSGPDGTVMVDLEERFMNVSIATRGSQGELTLDCASNLRQALELLLADKPKKPAAAPSKPAQPEKKEALDVR